MASNPASVVRTMEGAVIEASPKKKQVRAVWSDDSTDRYKTCFVQQGIDTSEFERNNVILWEHGTSVERGMLPVGNATEWGIDRYKGRNALIGVTRFWDGDEFAERRFADYRDGRLKGWSIRLIPDEASPPTAAERRARPDWGECELVYRSGRLIEVSAASIPGNAGCLTIAVERSGLAPPSLPAGADEPTIRAIARDFSAKLGRASKAIEEMGPDELRQFIAEMQLRWEAHRLKGLHENRERREAHKLFCEAVAQDRQRMSSRSAREAGAALANVLFGRRT